MNAYANNQTGYHTPVLKYINSAEHSPNHSTNMDTSELISSDITMCSMAVIHIHEYYQHGAPIYRITITIGSIEGCDCDVTNLTTICEYQTLHHPDSHGLCANQDRIEFWTQCTPCGDMGNSAHFASVLKSTIASMVVPTHLKTEQTALHPHNCSTKNAPDDPASSSCPVPAKTHQLFPSSCSSHNSASPMLQSKGFSGTSSHQSSAIVITSQQTSQEVITSQPTSQDAGASPQPTSQEVRASSRPTSQEVSTSPQPTSQVSASPQPTSQVSASPQPTSQEVSASPRPTSQEVSASPQPTCQEVSTSPQPTSQEVSTSLLPTSQEVSAFLQSTSPEVCVYPQPASPEVSASSSSASLVRMSSQHFITSSSPASGEVSALPSPTSGEVSASYTCVSSSTVSSDHNTALQPTSGEVSALFSPALGEVSALSAPISSEDSASPATPWINDSAALQLAYGEVRTHPLYASGEAHASSALPDVNVTPPSLTTEVHDLTAPTLPGRKDICTPMQETVCDTSISPQDTNHRQVGCHTTDGTLLTAPIKLNASVFATELADHPDQAFVHRIVSTCRSGVDIGYEGPDQTIISDNWPSADKHCQAVQSSIAKDLSYGRKLGPFLHNPFDTMVISPLGAFEKKRAIGKYRIVHDLSWPPGSSVNDFIPADKYSVSYMSVDDVVKKVQDYGLGTLLSKLDLADAFHHIVVRPDQWKLLGSSVVSHDANNNPIRQIYFSTVLPFGLRSSPALFSEFAHATKLIMLKRGVTECEHYLDDYVTLGPPDSSTCASNLQAMLNVCEDVGFDVNPSKVVQPTPVIEFLGIIIDSIRMELRISHDRLTSIMQELETWRGRKRARKRDLLSLIGKLIFVSRVVRCGRMFVRHMIDVAKKVRHLHHTVKLNREFQSDVTWWLTFLPTWNGISMMYDQEWTSSVDMHLYTDASNKAVSGFYSNAWFVELVEDPTITSINERELYAVVLAAATWSHAWGGKKVLFHCDNLAVCHILCNKTSKSPSLMALLRKLFYIAASSQFDFSAKWIDTKSNDVADALSRLDFSRFWKLVPDADIVMTQPAKLSAWPGPVE